MDRPSRDGAYLFARLRAAPAFLPRIYDGSRFFSRFPFYEIGWPFPRLFMRFWAPRGGGARYPEASRY